MYVSLYVCLFVSILKDIGNRWADMVLLYNVAFYRSSKIIMGTTTRARKPLVIRS